MNEQGMTWQFKDPYLVKSGLLKLSWLQRQQKLRWSLFNLNGTKTWKHLQMIFNDNNLPDLRSPTGGQRICPVNAELSMSRSKLNRWSLDCSTWTGWKVEIAFRWFSIYKISPTSGHHQVGDRWRAGQSWTVKRQLWEEVLIYSKKSVAWTGKWV